MQELGIEVPIPSERAGCSPWLRLQAQDRARSIGCWPPARRPRTTRSTTSTSAPTGDPTTDALLREIRKEERSHSHAPCRRCGPRTATAGARSQSRSLSRARVRGFDWILGREKWHRSGAAGSRRDLRRQRRPRRGLRHRRGRVRPRRAGRARADRGPLRRDRLGAVDGDRRVPRRALGGRGRRPPTSSASARRSPPTPRRRKRSCRSSTSSRASKRGHRRPARRAAIPRTPDAMLQALGAEEFGIPTGPAGSGDPVQAAIAAGISSPASARSSR